MAKPMMSNNLRNMKFMQRASQREEKPKKEDDEVVIPNGNFPAAVKKCVVIMEGDPHPGTVRGRMSFLSFNPSIDKLNDDTSNSPQSEAAATSSGRQSEIMSDRSNGTTRDGIESVKQERPDYDTNGELKRKQAEEASEAEYPNKSHKNSKNQKESSERNNRNLEKQPKKEKLDWNVLRPPKSLSKKKK